MSCVKCVLSVTFSGESSPVQQHRCGEPLLGQRQRQVSPRHDRLPITDHLPALEQHHRRRQVGVCACTFRDLLCSTTIPEPSAAPNNMSTRFPVLCPCREGKNQNEKTFGLPVGDIFKAIYRFVFAGWVQCNVWLPSCSLITLQIGGADGEVHGPDELHLGSGRTRHRDSFQPLLLPEHRGSGRSDPKFFTPPTNVDETFMRSCACVSLSNSQAAPALWPGRC